MKKFLLTGILGLFSLNSYAADIPNPKERWDAIRQLVSGGTEIVVNIGTEFPSGWLGLDDGQYRCFRDAQAGKNMIQPIPAPVVIAAPAVRQEIVQTQYIQPAAAAPVVCRT